MADGSDVGVDLAQCLNVQRVATLPAEHPQFAFLSAIGT